MKLTAQGFVAAGVMLEQQGEKKSKNAENQRQPVGSRRKGKVVSVKKDTGCPPPVLNPPEAECRPASEKAEKGRKKAGSAEKKQAEQAAEVSGTDKKAAAAKDQSA